MSDVVALLEELIRVPTPNPAAAGAPDDGERRLAQLCADRLARFSPDELRVIEVPRAGAVGAAVVARWGRPRVVVNAHLDTVPPNAGWTGDPFVPVRVDGGVRGLGAADTKGAIAAVLAALELRGRPPRDLLVCFSGDEELTGTVMRALLDEGALAGATQAVICEPTGLAAGVRHRGIVSVIFRLEGKGGHSSLADRLPAPVAALGGLGAAIWAWGQARRDEGPPGFPGLCVNVAALDGGIAFNVVPERAALTVSLRPPPGADVEALLGELRALAARYAPGATMETTLANPPFATGDVAAMRALVGDAPPVDLAFWTEAALVREAGVDAVVWGPGAIDRAHAADEWVAAAELERARDTLVALFARLDSPSGEAHGAG